ncbi:hypothetical protein ONS95_010641 [Cadophora gregata]|uniref:uncharacterized protein n=1 Tax=Cadophora gregata TaxID=51156 RepID=UPI0026DC996D|nr:uncharacterized protein ONS95_010641 [Cadophora gregata]KAK0122403.1 hypothetical protein ONS95_010641 [Cadophora gregata]KAK0127881.1 hypothetical protein ONS96_007381 [Cadophora gregata f. sp. sojae]
MNPKLIKVPRVDLDDDHEYVLLHIAPTGRKTLDLELIGTDNETAFVSSLKHSQLSKLKEKKINAEEWEQVLYALLLGTDPEGKPVSPGEGVEAVASIQAGAKSLTIIIQRNIEGITQKFGTLVLPRGPDDAADFYDWCSESVLENTKIAQELQASNLKLDEKDAQIKKLEVALAELVQLKNDNDTQLLEKFSLLLNEKKLKIRDQQRLLQSSNVDPTQVAELEEARSRSRSAGPSRKGKRKAGAVEEESDDGFEKMDVDNKPTTEDSDQEPAKNLDDSTADEETADEASEDDHEPAAPPPKRKTPAKQEQNSSQASSSKTLQELEPPPKRELPFAKKPPAKAPAPPPAAGSETESDDEL